MTELLLLLALLAPRDSLVVTWAPPAGVDSVQVHVEWNWYRTGEKGRRYTVPARPARFAYPLPPIWVPAGVIYVVPWYRIRGRWTPQPGDSITYTPPRRGLRLEIKRGDR